MENLFLAIRHRAYCFVISIILLFSGCITGNDDDPCPAAGTIDIVATIGGERITGNNFDAGDQIGVFVALSPGIPAVGNYAYNIPYTFDGTQWIAPGGSELPWPGTAELDIYGYWPYDASISTGNPLSYLFTVSADQTTRENYIRNDFLWARSPERAPGEPVPLLFTHSLSRVQINIASSLNVADDWQERANVAIHGLSRETTINLFDGKADNDPAAKVLKGTLIYPETPILREDNEIRPLVLENPEPGYELSLAAILTPQRTRPDIPLVSITLDGEEYAFIPFDELDLMPGETLAINLTLVEQPPGLIVDLDQIDWSLSRVWNVYDGNTVIAQVCREYLQGPSAPDVQAVVVYPISGKKIDFSAGYAARAYIRDKNEDGSYDVDPAKVHGGHVDFTATKLYTPGVLPPVRKIVIDPVSGITATYNAAPANLTVKPVTVEDYDNNRYPVVKINQWYWTASNLRATHYRNGNPLTASPYGGNPANTATYGLLYSGYTAYDPQGFLPLPWYLPLDWDYEQMLAYIQPRNGSKLKANSLWTELAKSDDVTGFSLLPGGYRNGSGVFLEMGATASLWTDIYNGFEGTYYYIGTEDETIKQAMITHEYAMSLRFVLTDYSALTGN